MKELAIVNKELRSQVKLLKTEFAAMNSIYRELREVISDEQIRLIIQDVKTVFIQNIGEDTIRDYLLRNKVCFTPLESVILQSLQEKRNDDKLSIL